MFGEAYGELDAQEMAELRKKEAAKIEKEKRMFTQTSRRVFALDKKNLRNANLYLSPCIELFIQKISDYMQIRRAEYKKKETLGEDFVNRMKFINDCFDAIEQGNEESLKRLLQEKSIARFHGIFCSNRIYIVCREVGVFSEAWKKMVKNSLAPSFPSDLYHIILSYNKEMVHLHESKSSSNVASMDKSLVTRS